MNRTKGYVYITGAGCGTADLITVRGLEALKSCDAVVYDDLIDTELLDAAPEAAVKIYMGKRLGRHGASQEEINARLIELAGRGLIVVRLKGGDPLVFGRGGEEALALRKAGIAYEIIPGISSCIAIPAMVGIPVTHRGLSRGFRVITAHTMDTPDGLPEDFDINASLNDTLVILMGLGSLGHIAERLISAGKPGTTPTAVISDGNSSVPALVRAPLCSIASTVNEAGVKAPAVIVIGPAAALDLRSDPGTYPDESVALPLKGTVIALTGTSYIQSRLAPALKKLGAEVFAAGHSIIKALDTDFDFSCLTDGKCHWIVLTSTNGVDIFFSLLRSSRIDLRKLSACRFAVIGPSTGRRLADYGISYDLCPEQYTGAGLLAALQHTVAPDEGIFLFRSLLGSRELYEGLTMSHAAEDIPTYTVIKDTQTVSYAARRIPEADYIVFASGNGVNMFLEAFGSIPDKARCVCIGETTAAALRRQYNKNVIVADDISAEGLIFAILTDRYRA